MAKTEKELKELKEKIENINTELMELSEEELSQVAGGLRRRRLSHATVETQAPPEGGYGASSDF